MSEFSKRTYWPQETNDWSRLLAQKKASGAVLYDLTASNPTTAGFAYLDERLLEPFRSTDNLVYDPDPQGILATRKCVSDYYQKKRATPLDAEDILLTSGTSDGYHYLFRLLTDPGDEILCTAPGYPLFDMLADINDIRVIKFELTDRSGEWAVDWEALEASFTSRTKVLLLVHPNNPTGRYWSQDEKRRLEDLCAKKKCALIVDEVFWDYQWDAGRIMAHFVDTNPKILKFTLNGISKVLGLPQMKLSWITVHGSPADRREAMHRLQMMGDVFLSVSTPIQRAAVTWFDRLDTIQEEILSRIKANRAYLKRALSQDVATVCPAEGGWYSVLALAGGRVDDQVALELLDKKNVILHPGYFFDFPEGEYVVVSLLARPDTLKEGVERWLSLYK